VSYISRSNTYGSLAGYGVGLVLRLSGGEPLLHFPAAIHYPMYDVETDTQYFPFKTTAMLASFFACVSVSLLTEYLFKSGILQPELDFLGCVVNISTERIVLPTDTSFNVSCETLAMQKMKSAGNGNGTTTESSPFLTANGHHVNGNCTTVVNEGTALHNFDNNHHDYLSTEAR